MNNMIVSVNPHIYAKDTTQTIMRDVLIALFPAVIASIVFFGVRALLVEVVCVAVAMACEWAFGKITRKPITPGQQELTQNPRSRSAKLRIAEKL